MDDIIIQQAVQMLAIQIPRERIIDRLSEAYPVVVGQIDEILSEAKKRLSAAAQFDAGEQLASAIKRTELICSQCIQTGDLKTALSAQRDLNRLLSLDKFAARRGETDDDPLFLEIEGDE